MAARRRSSAATAIVQSDGDSWLTRPLVEALVKAIEKEKLPKRFAALHCGVSPQTFETALQEGASGMGGPLAVELARRVYKATAKDVGQEMKDLQRLGKDDPKATILYLQAKYPEDFGGHVRTAPDEFAVPERQKRTRGMLLDNPPPRMLAEFRAHDWFRMPRGISPEDRAVILGVLAHYEGKPAPILTTGAAAETEPPEESGADGPHE